MLISYFLFTFPKHLLVHTGEKAFVCEHCCRRFSVASNRNRHVPRCPALKSHHSDTRRNSIASDFTDLSDSAFSSDIQTVPISIHRPQPLSGLTPTQLHTYRPSHSHPYLSPASPPMPQKKKRYRRPTTPVHWIPESLKGMQITDLKTYIRDYNAKVRKETQEARAIAQEEKARKRAEKATRRLLKNHPIGVGVDSGSVQEQASMHTSIDHVPFEPEACPDSCMRSTGEPITDTALDSEVGGYELMSTLMYTTAGPYLDYGYSHCSMPTSVVDFCSPLDGSGWSPVPMPPVSDVRLLPTPFLVPSSGPLSVMTELEPAMHLQTHTPLPLLMPFSGNSIL